MYRVLISEDDDDYRELLEALLHGYQCQTTTVGNGEVALALYTVARAGGNPYHLIVLDGALPGMTGFKVADVIRHQHSDTTTPILIVTAYHEAIARQYALHVGANALLEKPFSQDDFCTTVNNLLTKGNVADTARAPVD